MSLQPERTDLAWRRTGLSVLGLSLAGLKLGADQEAAHLVAAVVAAVAAGAFALLARWRSSVLRHVDRPPAMPARTVAGMVAAVAAIEAAGLALVLA